jgi:hypothetical protein
MAQAIHALGQRFPLQVAAMTAYDPDSDNDEKTLQTGLRLLLAIAQSAAASRRA